MSAKIVPWSPRLATLTDSCVIATAQVRHLWLDREREAQLQKSANLYNPVALHRTHP